jgi:uncharacterized protein (TIGR00730 family)
MTRDSELPHDLDDAVSRLLNGIDFADTDSRAKPLIQNLVATCVALAHDNVKIPDLKLVDSALKEIREAMLCFAPHDTVRKVSAFGSARTDPEAEEYALARSFSRAIVEAGFMVITGAGPGIMEACQQGAGRDNSFGVNIKLPFENLANEHIHGDEKLAEFKYFFTRKLFFLKESSAVVLFPGGFGTHDECFETLTLIQTGKSQLVPIVCIDIPGGTYWKTWDRYVRDHILRKKLIDEADLELYTVTDSVDDAVETVTKFYRVYHSSRFLRNRLVIRTNFDVSEPDVAEISREFADILRDKPIARHAAYDEERDEPETLHLPRLVLQFDMRSYGRLRQLVDRLNEAAPA